MTATDTDLEFGTEPDDTSPTHRPRRSRINTRLIVLAGAAVVAGVLGRTNPHLGPVEAILVIILATAYMLYIADTIRPSHERYRGGTFRNHPDVVDAALMLAGSIAAMVTGAVAALVPASEEATDGITTVITALKGVSHQHLRDMINSWATISSYFSLAVVFGFTALRAFKREPQNADD